MKKILKYQRHIFIGLFLLIFISFIFTVYSGRENIFKKFNYKTWEDKYNRSQWVIPQSKNEISDDDLYIFTGSMLIEGNDPSLFSAEVPPLGKYLIGLFNKITGVIGIYGIFFSATSLMLLFILNKIIFKSNIIAIIPVVLFSFEYLFRKQIGVSLLDTQYLSFLLLSFIFLLKEKYLLTGISAGLFMATKSPFIGVLLYATIFSYLVINKKIKFSNSLIMPIASIFTYLAVNIRYFVLGHNIIDFLKVQKYMLHFYQTGAKGVIGAVFPMVFTGYWFTWFNKNQFINDWTILWPIVFVFSVFVAIKFFKKLGKTGGFTLMSIWLLLYFAFLIFTPMYPRYLLLALPFMYNLAVWGLLKLTKPQLLSESF